MKEERKQIYREHSNRRFYEDVDHNKWKEIDVNKYDANDKSKIYEIMWDFDESGYLCVKGYYKIK